MHDDFSALNESLSDLAAPAWKARMAEIAEEHGMFQELGDRHFASFIDHGNTLLVTFESIAGIQKTSDDAHPVGFQMVRDHGWSHLCFVSDGDTWFRDSRVFGFFDQLIDDGFFEDFDSVLFYGAGPCGYAASAFSVAAPGARVIAVQPQATLDPRMTEWDDRFTEMRRVDFTDRYGYAPDMLDAAHHAIVLYDPYQELDAMHAALFERPNISRFRMPLMGAALQSRITAMGILVPMLMLAA
ncbi:MAG: phosphoadenosine phosphosulfate reductase, partial [Paracoccaceae bacterium]